MAQAMAAPYPLLHLHRTDEFPSNDGVFWDRRRRVDFLFQSGETPTLQSLKSAARCQQETPMAAIRCLPAPNWLWVW